MRTGKISYSKILIPLLCVILLLIYYINPFSNVLTWDVFGYYLYLPAQFIYHDLGLKDQTWLNSIIQNYHSTPVFCQAMHLEDGSYVMVYNMGLAVLNAPFFFLANWITPLTNYPADGFSYPYQLAIIISAQVYMVIGLCFLRKVLLQFVNELITCITLVLVVLGTNYFQMNTYGITMPHSYLFTLAAIFLWATLKWESARKVKYVIIIGLSGGLATLIRPTEFVIFLLFVFWGTFNRKNLIERYKLFLKYKKQMLFLMLAFILVILPQFIYWKVMTGGWICYAHPTGVALELTSPHLINVLFSFRKGWFIYTPVMIFSLIGFIYLFKKQKQYFFAFLIYFIVNLYVISSWTHWWYGDADFSNRALVPSYALLSIPLAIFITNIYSKKIKYLFLLLFTFFIALYLFQFWQFQRGIISSDRMTMKYYFKVFGKTKIDPNDSKYLMVGRSLFMSETIPDMDQYDYKVIGWWDFEHSVKKDFEHYVTDTSVSGKQSFALDSSEQFSPGLNMPFLGITGKDYAWIRATVNVFIPKGYHEELPLLVATFNHKKDLYCYKTKSIPNDSLKYGAWNFIALNYMTPEVMNERDKLTIYVWHRGKQRILIDNLKIEVFEPF
jgi:hypothetical protein